jgi:predicted nicotinamide N-methyase
MSASGDPRRAEMARQLDWDPAEPERLIRAQTRLAHPWSCPEIRLHITTEECRLWRAGEEEIEALGLGSPFWAFCWPGGEALARHLLDHPEEVAGKRVLDFGTGGGVAAIAAAKAGARVLASDLDALARRCVRLNAAANGVDVEVSARDWLGDHDLPVDCVLVGDVTYQPELAAKVCSWIEALRGRGVSALLADPGRGCLPSPLPGWLEPVARYRAPTDSDRGFVQFAEVSVLRTSALEPLRA